MGHEDDDCHAIEPAPHNIGFCKTSSSFKKMSPTGTSGMFSISPEEPQRDEPTWVPIDDGGRKNIAQYLRPGTERGRNIKLVIAKFS